MIETWFRRNARPELEEEGTLLTPGGEPARKPRVIVSLDRSWHNLLGLTRLTFYHLIRRAGGVPRWVDYGTGPEPDDLVPLAGDIVARGDALILSGGSDVDPRLYGASQVAARVNPRRDRFEMALIRAAQNRRLPVLGICRGCQLLNVLHRGTLRTIRADRHLQATHNAFRRHAVFLDPASRVARSTRRRCLSILSIHGQAVDRPGDGLRVVGRAEDGVVEAIEAPPDSGSWTVGVQWHPEYMFYARPEHRLIRAFVDQARAHRADSHR